MKRFGGPFCLWLFLLRPSLPSSCGRNRKIKGSTLKVRRIVSPKTYSLPRTSSFWEVNYSASSHQTIWSNFGFFMDRNQLVWLPAFAEFPAIQHVDVDDISSDVQLHDQHDFLLDCSHTETNTKLLRRTGKGQWIQTYSRTGLRHH